MSEKAKLSQTPSLNSMKSCCKFSYSGVSTLLACIFLVLSLMLGWNAARWTSPSSKTPPSSLTTHSEEKTGKTLRITLRQKEAGEESLLLPQDDGSDLVVDRLRSELRSSRQMMAKLIDQLDEERGKNIELESLRNQRLQFFSRTSIWRRDMRLASQEPTSRVLSPLARVFIIHQERPDGKLQYTYSPFIKTLLAGFKTLDVAVKLVKADRNSAEGRKGGLEKKLLLQKLRKDDVLVLVGSQEPSFQDDYVQIANSVKVKRGLFTVLYQTETLLLGRPGACSSPLRRTTFDEVWDYSAANIDMMLACRANPSFPLIRYVPLAYWSDEPKISYMPRAPPRTLTVFLKPSVPIDLEAAVLPPPPAAAAQRKAAPTSLIFLGDYEERHECWQGLRRRPEIEKDLRSRYNVWSKEAYARFVESHSSAIFLSLPQPCSWEDNDDDHNNNNNNNNNDDDDNGDTSDETKANRKDSDDDDSYRNQTFVSSDNHRHHDYMHLPMEPITSVLLNSHALVISSSSYYESEEEWAGIVTFVRTPEDVEREYCSLRALQPEQRQDEADRRAELFAERFAPAAIFRRAGLDKLFGSR